MMPGYKAADFRIPQPYICTTWYQFTGSCSCNME